MKAYKSDELGELFEAIICILVPASLVCAYIFYGTTAFKIVLICTIYLTLITFNIKTYYESDKERREKMRAWKCDRCGKLFEPDEDSTKFRVEEYESDWNYKEVDLCPSCLDELEKFMNKEKHK